MSEKEMLTKKFILVDMNDAEISTAEKPIIGTAYLATCLGVLLYSEDEKRAIVAHMSSNVMPTLDKIFKIIVENKWYRLPLKYKIIWGTDREPAEFYNVIDVLEKHFADYTPFTDEELPECGIRTNENTMSNEFAFDASTGKFVTDKVLFGVDYYLVNGDEGKDNSNGIKHK